MAWKRCKRSDDIHIFIAPGPAPSCSPKSYPAPGLARQQGRTLLEMMIVVAIIGLMAALTVPSSAPANQRKLDLAGAEVADAFRFAREEARRTGTMHGVATDIPNDLVRVFRLDEGPDPNLKVFDVYHPVTKQLYAIQLSGPPYNGVTLSGDGGQMVGTCNDPGNYAFDSGGVVRCTEPTATRINSAYVDLTAGQLTQSVVIDSYTGRLSIQ